MRLFTGYRSLSLFTAFFLLLLPFASYQLFQIHLLETRSLSSKAQNLLLSTRAHLENQGKNFALMRAYRNPDPYYLNHSLETLSFLQEEQKQLEKVVHHPHFPGDTVITERLRKLSEHNKIRFIEGKVQTYKYYTERTETFSEPIEVSAEDVETVLGILEGRNKEYKKGSPLLLFLDFHLKKKTGSSYSVFEMHCKLLKREFYQ